MSDREAGRRFFEFRIADIAMGSGHFLVGAVDRIERRLANYLAGRPLPDVREELARLRRTAAGTWERSGLAIRSRTPNSFEGRWPGAASSAWT